MTTHASFSRPPASPLALFCDFDGTLVDLAARPDGVLVPANLLATLRAVRERLGGGFAIVTGRPIAAVDEFFAPERFAIAGAHGTERRRADGRLEAPAPALVAASDAIHAAVAGLARADQRLVLERKAGAVALHYRLAPEREAESRARMTEAVAAVEGFALIEGKKVLEARPAGIDKGVAITAFLHEAPFKGRLPIFFGDDTTDEDGFAVVQDRGGLGIKVGAGPTMAAMGVPDVTAVHRLLAEFASPHPPRDLADMRALAAETAGVK